MFSLFEISNLCTLLRERSNESSPNTANLTNFKRDHGVLAFRAEVDEDDSEIVKSDAREKCEMFKVVLRAIMSNSICAHRKKDFTPN